MNYPVAAINVLNTQTSGGHDNNNLGGGGNGIEITGGISGLMPVPMPILTTQDSILAANAVGGNETAATPVQ